MKQLHIKCTWLKPSHDLSYLNGAIDIKPAPYGEIHMPYVPFIQTFKAMCHNNKDNNTSGVST